jgi:protein-tyrosine sulfotransferase
MIEAKAGNPIFIGGVPRSGTTLLRVILDSHPNIYCGTELRVVHALANLWSATEEPQTAHTLRDYYGVDAEASRKVFANLILSFLTPAWLKSGKRRIAEKTPSNLLAFKALRQLFPDSPLIHVIRDGRDVVASRLERDRALPAQGIGPAELAATRAQEWVDAMQLRADILADSRLAAAYLEIRYESLVQTPQPTLEPVFAFVGEQFDMRVLDFHQVERNVAGTEEWSADAVRKSIFTSSIGRWREALSAVELEAVLSVAGRSLQQLGYST